MAESNEQTDYFFDDNDATLMSDEEFETLLASVDNFEAEGFVVVETKELNGIDQTNECDPKKDSDCDVRGDREDACK